MLGFRTRTRRLAVASLSAVTVCALAAACSAGSPTSDSEGGAGPSTEGVAGSSAPLEVTTSIDDGASGVPVSELVRVAAAHGTLSAVRVTSDAGPVEGALADDGATWTATDRLEPGATYTVAWRGADGGGEVERGRSSFTTADLTLDEQTYPSVAPLQGETVGVGMPVIVNFDLPVTAKKKFEENMIVTSTPQQAGSWRWVSDTEAHWRPKAYWEPGTDVDVAVDVNGVDAGNGIYGQENRDISFSVGDAHVYRVNAATHQMEVLSNGQVLRTIPITTGKEGFTTRSGTKVIMEKFASKRMNSETVGIPQGSSESYDIDNVQYAMRLTSSGEFIHAAPWSVGSQGSANVSHGCTGMSTDNAAWLYAMTLRGDVVEYTGTDRPMEPDNGWGDWNISWPDYKAGSALT